MLLNEVKSGSIPPVTTTEFIKETLVVQHKLNDVDVCVNDFASTGSVTFKSGMFYSLV